MQTDSDQSDTGHIDEVGLGKMLSEARNQAGLTQQELCNKAGLSYSTLAKIERGAIKSPSVFTIISIAQVLGRGLDELLGFKASPTDAGKKRSKRGVRFIYFDINGCLVRFYHQAFERIAADKKVSIDEVETVFWKYNNDICRGNINLAQLNQKMSENLKVAEIDWQTYYMEAAQPIAESHQLLSWAAEHYYVGLLSNIMPGFIDDMIKRGLIPNLSYDAIIDSSVVGAIKPEPEIYQYAEEKTGLKGSEILFIDDSRSNLSAASNRGWHVLWFDTNNPADSVVNAVKALEVG